MEVRHWIRRPAAAVIAVTGEDSADFLQSQFSADLRIETGAWKRGLWLNHKGRIQAESCVLKLGAEHFILFSSATPSALLIEKLDRHIISEEVELEDVTAHNQVIQAYARQDPLAPVFPEQSVEGLSQKYLYQDNCYRLTEQLGELTQLLIFGEKAEIATVETRLAEANFTPWNEAAFKRFRIEHTLVEIPAEVGPEETPSEVGLNSLCSLSKGCYLGQEVVNRQARLERSNRQLVCVEFSAPATRAPAGSYPPILANEQTVGELRCSTEEAPYRGLAMLKSKALEKELTLDGQTLKVCHAR